MADLHVHSVLSPCASIEMTPDNIITNAVNCGTNIVAITDHNACDNVYAAMEAAVGTGVVVIPGIEVETKEEIHLVALFNTIAELISFDKFVRTHLSALANDENRFGAQLIVDARGNFINNRREMLLSSLTCGVDTVTAEVISLGGICIASHIDRPAYSILSQLGFIPPDAILAAVEVSRRTNLQAAPKLFPAIGRLPVITSSDAHYIRDFIAGPKTMFYIEKPTLDEIKQALSSRNNRKILAR